MVLTTINPGGRPHTTGIGHIWHEGAIHFATGPAVRKTRNLLADSRCSIAGALTDYDVVFDGTAERVTEPALLAALVAKYNDVGWPAEVEGDAITAPYSAPSAGPAPWHLYRFTIGAVTALKTTGEGSATRWRFRLARATVPGGWRAQSQGSDVPRRTGVERSPSHDAKPPTSSAERGRPHSFPFSASTSAMTSAGTARSARSASNSS